MDQIELEERSGIYLFILPKWKMGYVGRTNNLKRRYTEHVFLGSHKKEIKNYLKVYNDIEFMILEYTDDYKAKDQATIEKHWIEHYKRKNIKLLNITDPEKELGLIESKAIVAYDKDTLELKGRWNNYKEIIEELNIKDSSPIYGAINRAKATVKGKTYTYKNCFWFFEDDFTQEILKERKQEYEESNILRLSKARRKQKDLNGLYVRGGCKLIGQFSQDGNLLNVWGSIRQASNQLKISCSTIRYCASGLRNSKEFIWKYLEDIPEGFNIIPSGKNRIYKKTLQYSLSGEFIKEWKSATEAGKSLGICFENISSCATGRGRNKSAGGFIWKYMEESELENESIRFQNF